MSRESTVLVLPNRLPGVPKKPSQLQRIPAEYDKEQACEALQKTLFHEDEDVSIHVLSLATDPEQLAEVNGRSRATKPESRLSFDAQFNRFTCVYTLQASEWTMDIVAASGPNAHPFGSFKRESNRFMWLLNALP
ncbi:hypothetical protein MPH_12093 [Macrophomina phaseolina MS6]|uniref:Uncharacterized protein n=1 Tax=Macrophomina phaseolina (strain MS6) TaxID=1126212 RepID=K2RCY9_MACPH|nr:hypothetical protein MPH_12093 [Macrophomina phaseolina MS6]